MRYVVRPGVSREWRYRSVRASAVWSTKVKKMLWILTPVVLLAPVMAYLIGSAVIRVRANDEVETLRAQSTEISRRVYRPDQIEGLPEPVKRYFSYALTEGLPYISFVEVRHDGEFRVASDKAWIPIEGRQYFSVEEPGFVWIGKTNLFTVRDMYLSGSGRIIVSLLNLITVEDGHGSEYDQGELLRWLCESVWFPTNLLPSDRVRWSAVDDETAMLEFIYRQVKLSVIVRFDSIGRIIRVEAMRHKSDEGFKPWIGRMTDYREINGMVIPMSIEAIWMLGDKEESYAKFNVQEIHHD